MEVGAGMVKTDATAMVRAAGKNRYVAEAGWEEVDMCELVADETAATKGQMA